MNGRPPKISPAGERLEDVIVRLYPAQRAYADAKGNRSQFIRELIDGAMRRELQPHFFEGVTLRCAAPGCGRGLRAKIHR